mmetsp:Transcript_43840/g.80063  ORF Transcript_43840/g.80063 Transcript_43840/m.80063 type:complete len:269 (+) Transcript_43840:1373-2179(+)
MWCTRRAWLSWSAARCTRWWASWRRLRRHGPTWHWRSSPPWRWSPWWCTWPIAWRRHTRRRGCPWESRWRWMPWRIARWQWAITWWRRTWHRWVARGWQGSIAMAMRGRLWRMAWRRTSVPVARTILSSISVAIAIVVAAFPALITTSSVVSSTSISSTPSVIATTVRLPSSISFASTLILTVRASSWWRWHLETLRSWRWRWHMCTWWLAARTSRWCCACCARSMHTWWRRYLTRARPWGSSWNQGWGSTWCSRWQDYLETLSTALA